MGKNKTGPQSQSKSKNPLEDRIWPHYPESKTPETIKYRERSYLRQRIHEDDLLDSIVTDDMFKIQNEVGGQDGMYQNFPIFRIYRDEDGIRAYGLDGSGGVMIYQSPSRDFYQVLTLGEDDALHFLSSSRIFSTYSGKKSEFIYLLTETLSLFNADVEG